MKKEELIELVKASGQEIIDRAEDLVGDGDLITDFDIWKAGLEKLWRWSDDNGGGIVKARTIEEAKLKLSKYGRKDCTIWLWLKDDCYDEKNPDVFDIY